MDPRGKTAILTGGARVGATVAEALARRGCNLVLAYRKSGEAARESVRRAEALGVKALALRADVRRAGDAERLVRSAVSRMGGVDILINMASYYGRADMKALGTRGGRRAAFEAAVGTDLWGSYEMSLLAAPHMKRAGGGRIVNFCDWVAASGRPRYAGYIPYYSAKTGVKGLTEALALELAPRILVNAVAPGPILAPAGLSRAADHEVLANTPLRRWGGPEEVAKAVLFLVDSDFVTGETIRVDGGRHLS